MQMTKAHCTVEEPKLSSEGIVFDPINSAATDQSPKAARPELEMASFSIRDSQSVNLVESETVSR